MMDEDYKDDSGQIYEIALTVFMLLACGAAFVLGVLAVGIVYFMVFP
jgi:hypothetical protein